MNLIHTVLGDTWVQIVIRILCVLIGGGVCEVFASPEKAWRSQSSRESDARPQVRSAPAGYASVSVSGAVRSDSEANTSRSAGRASRGPRGEASRAEVTVAGATVSATKNGNARGPINYFTGPRCIPPRGERARCQKCVREKSGSAASVVPNGYCRTWNETIPWKWRSLSEINGIAGDVPVR